MTSESVRYQRITLTEVKKNFIQVKLFVCFNFLFMYDDRLRRTPALYILTYFAILNY